jgi:hypothetical protein
MSTSPSSIRPTSARLLADYLRAKDAQLPHLYDRVFAVDAAFRPTYAVPTPFGEATPSVGLPAVRETFRRMGTFCENIVTVVPVESLDEQGGRLRSRWVVAMTVREGGAGFVGWGTYVWTWTPEGDLAVDLAVEFQGMVPFAADEVGHALDALLGLSHPWCGRDELAAAVGAVPKLDRLHDWVMGAGPALVAPAVAAAC